MTLIRRMKKDKKKFDNLDFTNNDINVINVIFNSEHMNHFVGACEAFALSEGLTNASSHNTIQIRSEWGFRS